MSIDDAGGAPSAPDQNDHERPDELSELDEAEQEQPVESFASDELAELDERGDLDDPEKIDEPRRLGNGGGDFWRATGRLAARTAVKVGNGLAAAYNAVDPDLRRHVALLPVVGVTQLLGGDGVEPVAPCAAGDSRIVLFVHGLGGQPGNFAALRAWLRLRGHRRHYAFPLTCADKDDEPSLLALSETLREQISAVREANGLGEHEAVNIVAHSMGGVVSRLALEDPSVAAGVGVLVTLGTPHQGTWVARVANTSLTRALRPGSAVLRRLEDQLPWRGRPQLPPLFAFWSPADMLLLPHSTGAVPGARNIEVTSASHFGYLLRPAVWRKIYRLLATDPQPVAST